MYVANYGSYYLATCNRNVSTGVCIKIINLWGNLGLHALIRMMMATTYSRNVTSGYMEQAPLASAIARYYSSRPFFQYRAWIIWLIWSLLNQTEV